jgi:hypothetical protein
MEQLGFQPVGAAVRCVPLFWLAPEAYELDETPAPKDRGAATGAATGADTRDTRP